MRQLTIVEASASIGFVYFIHSLIVALQVNSVRNALLSGAMAINVMTWILIVSDSGYYRRLGRLYWCWSVVMIVYVFFTVRG